MTRRSPRVAEGSAAPAVRISIRTPAKINLGLRITGRREDGYHLLESIFVPIDLYDEVEIELSPGPDAIEFDLVENPVSELPPALRIVSAGSDNLVVRAARAFREATGLTGRIRLALHKSIPAGAGLGGGSSDAGAVLRGLSSLAADRGVQVPMLADVALGLGADVPFFLAPTPSLVTGIGELIEPIPGMRALHLVIANPGISVATADVFRVADELPDSLTTPEAGSTMRAISRLNGESDGWVHALGDLVVNHLETAAIRICPSIERLLSRMKVAGAVAASMSGSGATVFGVFESAEQAVKAVESLRSTTESSRTGSGSGQEIFWARATRVITTS